MNPSYFTIVVTEEGILIARERNVCAADVAPIVRHNRRQGREVSVIEHVGKHDIIRDDLAG